VTFSIDYYDSSAAAAPYRQIASLIDGAGSSSGQLISLGMNNNHTTATDGGNYYMARILGVAGGTNAVSAFFKLNDGGAGTLRSTGWHNLKVVVSDTDFKFYVDGILAKTIANAVTLRSYNLVRLGSGITSVNAANMDNVSVSVSSPALNITAQPANISTNAGSTVQFSVTAAGATVYQWKKDGADISGATDSSLTLNNVQVADEGSYSVYIENGYYATNSASATLTVNAAAAQPTDFVSTVAGMGSFVGTPGATYTVQYTDSLSPINWQTLTNVVTDGGTGVGTFTDSTDPTTLPERYYRITAP
jgi:hypothetical protein